MVSKEQLQQLGDKKVLGGFNDTPDFFELQNFRVIVGDIEKHIENVPILEPSRVPEWIDEWRQLFPKGLNSINRAYRGDRQACLNKMKTFVKIHRYPKDIIMKATQKAIKIAELKNFEYFPQAHYFIDKHGQSQLAGICEQLDDITDARSRFTVL